MLSLKVMDQIMKNSIIFFIGLLLAGCADKQKSLGDIEKGMSKSEVISLAGEPAEKNNIGLAELWVYPDSNRTVVFRSDTVYDIMTSTEARIDSIASGLDSTGKEIKEKTLELGEKIDSLGNELRNNE